MLSGKRSRFCMESFFTEIRNSLQYVIIIALCRGPQGVEMTLCVLAYLVHANHWPQRGEMERDKRTEGEEECMSVINAIIERFVEGAINSCDHLCLRFCYRSV